MIAGRTSPGKQVDAESAAAVQNRLPRCTSEDCRHAQRRPSQVNLPPRPRLPQAEAEVLEDAPERAEGVKVKAEADAEVQARG